MDPIQQAEALIAKAAEALVAKKSAPTNVSAIREHRAACRAVIDFLGNSSLSIPVIQKLEAKLAEFQR